MIIKSPHVAKTCHSSMAMNHRKLFPSNQTQDCSDFYNCYPFSDYYFLPPPPPPPPPKSTNHVTPYVIIIVVTLVAAFFLLLGYYAIFVKNYFRRNCFQPPQTSDGGDEEFLDENHGPTIDHPIWYITTIGLQPSIISSITVIKYNKGDGLVEGTDCSVCLNEFQEGQTLRLLPKCNHAFHIPCIDTWLSSHTNCPLCRAAIVPTTANNPPVDSNEATHIIISEAGQELVTNQNRAETEDEFEFPGVDDEIETKDLENSKKDLGSNGDGVEVSDNNYVDMENGRQIQRVRRSFSMDLSVIESEERSVNPRVDVENISDATKREFMVGGSSVLESLHKRPVSMKRSFSYSGRPFLSRNYRNPKPILPL